MNPKANPKALNLEIARQSQAKVTTGFKLDPQLKIQFAENAEKMGLTLSKYIGGLVSENEEFINDIRREEFALIKLNSELKNRLSLYETIQLKKLFMEQKGKTLFYFSNGEQKVEVIIKDLPDVNVVIQNSFKIKKDA